MKQMMLIFGLICGSLVVYWTTNLMTTAVITVDAAFAEPNTANLAPAEIGSNYPEEIQQWGSLISTYAQANELDPDLVAALIWQESGGDPNIVSRDGAVGLMQIMPRDGKAAEFLCVNGPCFADRPSSIELKDPTFNIAWGTSFLHSLLLNRGNLRDALKAYGPANAGYSYADTVLEIYRSYAADSP